MRTAVFIHATEAQSAIDGYRMPDGEIECVVLHLGENTTIFLSPENAERLSAELAKLQVSAELAKFQAKQGAA